MKDPGSKFFEKIPLDKVYEDLFQDGLKKAGEALATVLDLSNTILLPVKLLNEKSRIRFRINMEQYESNLNKIDKEKLCSVPEYVGIPILDKLTYLNEDQLSKQFINSLTKASSTDTLKLVHPAFIKTLKNLCSDEAKIL